MKLSLRSKITTLLLGLILGLGAVVFASFSWLTKVQIDRTIRHDVESATLVMNRLVKQRSEELQSQTKLIADLPTFQSAVVTGNAPTVEDRAKVYGARLGAQGLTVTDRDGKRLATTGAHDGQVSDLSKEPGVQAALDGKDWSGVRAIQGHLMLTTTVPIMVHGFAQGTLTAYSEIGAETASQIKESLSTDVAFMLGDRIVGSTLPGFNQLSSKGADPTDIRVGSTNYVGLRASLAGAGGGASFVVLQDKSALTSTYDQFTFAFLSVLILSSLVAFVAAGRFASQVSSPLGGVVSAARLLCDGEWPDRFEVTRQDEIGILQSAFNEMSASLQTSQQKLIAMIDCDPLTELDNHRRFKENLELEVSRAVSTGEPLSLLLVNLDKFDEFNHERGHAAGDDLLKGVAEVLRGLSPAVAHLARQSGDGFSVSLPLTGIEEASELADQIRTAILSLGVTASCGCAEAGPGTEAAGTLILAAEIALERAKQLGRNQVGRYDKVAGAEGASDPRELNEYIKDASLATVQALAAAVDAKDHYTRGHSQRVAEYASRLCSYVGGTQAEIDLTYRTGTLHDVGKIGVPDSILNKPGRLTGEERAAIETHPVVGELIVKKVPQLAETLTGVRNHHERWDGKGYPDGLKGTECSKLARTLAIADTYDAMTSDRPYRKGMPVDVALQEIAKGAGSQFDPYLASAFAKMMWEEIGNQEQAAA